MSTEAERVGVAIHFEFLRQRVDPTGLSSLQGIVPPLDWNAIGEAAIRATDHYAQTVKSSRVCIGCLADAGRERGILPTGATTDGYLCLYHAALSA